MVRGPFTGRYLLRVVICLLRVADNVLRVAELMLQLYNVYY